MKTICIDARLWGIAHTGIGRYVENLIDHLPQDPQVKIVLILSPAHFSEAKLAKYEKFQARFHPYSLMSLLEMHWLLFFKIRPQLLHIPHVVVPFLWPGKIILTIHDLIKHQSRGPQASTHSPLVYWLKYLQYLLMVWVSVTRARHILVPSQYWKDDLVRRYMLAPSKITVTHEGVPPQFTDKHKTFRYPLQLPRPYVVYTGNLYPHKNVPVLISALEIVNKSRKQPLTLNVVCARSIFESRLPISPHVKFLGRLSDEDLVILYHHALAFVFPSLIEGFGLPGLEAMATGCPVIAAWASCLPEIYGSAALYFDPHSPQDLADKINMLMSDSKLRAQLVRSGKNQVAKYSWRKMSNTTWQIYHTELH